MHEIRITDPTGATVTVFRSGGFSACWPRAIEIKRVCMPGVEVEIWDSRPDEDTPMHRFRGDEKKMSEYRD